MKITKENLNEIGWFEKEKDRSGFGQYKMFILNDYAMLYSFETGECFIYLNYPDNEYIDCFRSKYLKFNGKVFDLDDLKVISKLI